MQTGNTIHFKLSDTQNLKKEAYRLNYTLKVTQVMPRALNSY